ncbi:MAG: YolD-like family protein [Clostridia bacterium]|nr:YolD-like family protein [Clostridia bacterium]
MPQSVRAKQFLPFAALKGLPEALAEKEKETVVRASLSEESEALIDSTLRTLQKGMTVELTYYDYDSCVKIRGTVDKIYSELRIIRINGKDIVFDDISDVVICP